MTIEEMVSLVDLMIENVEERIIPTNAVVSCLNRAQDYVVERLHPHHLYNELGIRADGKTITSGKFQLSGLSDEMLRSNVIIAVINSANEAVLRRRSFQEYTDDMALSTTPFGANNPKYYLYGGYIYVLPTDIATIDILYLKAPTAMAMHADLGGAGTDCILATITHDIIIHLAASYACSLKPVHQDWNMKRKDFFEMAMEQIRSLNESAPATDSNDMNADFHEAEDEDDVFQIKIDASSLP